jgi:putative ABC transport system permease protein
VWTVTISDLRYRARQFLIAVVGAGLLLAMAVLLTGMAAGFRAEIRDTVRSVGADRWVVSAGATGPFTSTAPLPSSLVTDLTAAPGVLRADPIVVLPEESRTGSARREAEVIGFVPGGFGQPRPDRGRPAALAGEATVDARFHLGLGATFAAGGQSFHVVGLVHGRSLFGGTPLVYVTLSDAQRMAFHGLPLASAIVTSGVPSMLPAGTAALSEAEVRSDLLHQMKGAINSMDNSRSMMWIVAAFIVAALIYVSVIQRVRDFAVLKALGASSKKLFAGVAAQSVAVTVVAAVIGGLVSSRLKALFVQPITLSAGAFVTLPVIALVVGLAASAVAIRPAVAVDPTVAFSGG